VHISNSFEQIGGDACSNPAHAAHAAGNDHHPPGSHAATGDAGGLIVPPVALKNASIAVQPFAPEAGLSFGIYGHLNPQLGVPHLVSSSAEDQVHVALVFKQKLQGAFRQLLC